MTNLHWQDSTLDENDNMESAIKNLNEESTRIILVVNKSMNLLGTITDGDVRRAILEDKSMSTPLSEFMNLEPTIASVSEDRESILKLMKDKDLLQIPILNSENQLVGLETIHHLIEDKKYPNPVFLMAGGFGRRLAPLTNDMPKPLLKVGSKPILETILNKFIEAGFSNFYISTHFMAEKIREFFGNGDKWGVSIKYVHEETPIGTGGALSLLPKDKIKLPIIMMNGDLLSKVNFSELLRYHNKKGGEATMCVSEYEYQVPYGVVKQKDHKLIKIDEKPSHNFFINAGIYVIEPSVLSNIKNNQFLDMPSLLEDLVERDGQVNIFPIHEYWLDVGHPADFSKAKEDIKDHD